MREFTTKIKLLISGPISTTSVVNSLNIGLIIY